MNEMAHHLALAKETAPGADPGFLFRGACKKLCACTHTSVKGEFSYNRGPGPT